MLRERTYVISEKDDKKVQGISVNAHVTLKFADLDHNLIQQNFYIAGGGCGRLSIHNCG